MFCLWAAALSGCNNSPEPDSYFPLEEGRVWKYVMSGEVEAFAGWRLQREGWRRQTASRALDNYIVAVEAQGVRSVNGKEATPFMASSDLNRDFWFSFAVRDEAGFAEVGRQKRGAQPEALSPPVYVLRFPLRAGRGWDVDEPWEFFGEKIDLSGRAEITGTNETVTVPAGTFRHCVRVETESSGSRRIEHLHGRDVHGEATFERRKTEWFAPKVGLVKATESATVTPATLGSAEQMLELYEFKQNLARP